MKRDSGYKKLHKKILKVLSAENKALENDNLWRGRFVLREIQYKSKMYEDKSGYWGFVLVRAYDKKTGIYRDQVFDEYQIIHYSWKFFNFINDFIIKDVGVWEENPDPRSEDFNKGICWKNVEPRALKNAGWDIRI